MKSFKIKNKLLACLVLLATVCHAKEFKFVEARTGQFHAALSNYFHKYRVYEIPASEIANFVSQKSSDISFELLMGADKYSLTLELNDLRGKDFKAVMMTENGEVEIQQHVANTYKGLVDNDETNVTRLSIDHSTFEGYISRNGKRVFFDLLNRFIPGANSKFVVVYEPVDVRSDPNHICGVSEANSEINNLFEHEPTPENESSTGPCKFLEIATEADFEYYQDFSSNVNTALNRIRTILNQVEGLYTGTFKVKFVLRYQQIWTTAADPYSGDTLQGILPQFTNWWNANRTSINRDVTHMFTGRSISNTTVGFAWIGVVCDANWYYSTVTNFSPVTMSTINLSTHELGHNFGAGHDITCNPSSIMCPNIQSGSVGWAATSITEINSHLNTISCLDESFPNSITFPSPGFPISYAKVLAINSIAINSALGPVEISNSGFAHLEAGNEIVLSPTVFNTTGFIANEGSAVLLRISDMVNTCLPLRLMPDNEVHITAADLSIFPNPANEFITVKLTSDAQTILKIYNSTMQLLKTIPFENGLENQISTADLSTGIYFIDAQSGNQSYKTKLVVNR